MGKTLNIVGDMPSCMGTTPQDPSSVEQELETLSQDFSEDATLPLWITNNEGIYELEKQHIFHKTWNFLAHESEIPDPGDYVVRYIADDPLIVSRDEDGEIGVYFNACRHRGMKLCNTEGGNTSHFRCPYHGWTYGNDGNLIGVPYEHTCFGDEGLDHDDWGLRSPPNVDSYQGMIFANLDPDAESLDTFLGDYKYYLDLYVGMTEGGIEVTGPPQRWIVDADWKIGSDNFIGDDYHTAVTHGSIPKIREGRPDKPSQFKGGVQAAAGAGGACWMSLDKREEHNLTMEFEEEEHLLDHYREGLSDDQFELMMEYGLPVNGTLFPNLSFLRGRFRKWRPVGPGKMEVWSWTFAPKEASEEYKEQSHKQHVSDFGSAGNFEMDDSENWRRICELADSKMAQQQNLNYQMGLNGEHESAPDWSGPGKTEHETYNDMCQRHFWNMYFEWMTGE
jgi:phenylpropionate dioxygenase-like ring-hydroxylating dioxygenase large terminal subunit